MLLVSYKMLLLWLITLCIVQIQHTLFFHMMLIWIIIHDLHQTESVQTQRYQHFISTNTKNNNTFVEKWKIRQSIFSLTRSVPRFNGFFHDLSPILPPSGLVLVESNKRQTNFYHSFMNLYHKTEESSEWEEDCHS